MAETYYYVAGMATVQNIAANAQINIPGIGKYEIRKPVKVLEVVTQVNFVSQVLH